MTYGLGHTLQTGHGANGAKDVGRITALAATGFQQIMRLSNSQDGIEDTALGAVKHQAATELAQDRVMNAEVGEFQAEQVLPVDARANRIGCLAVGQAFPKLEQGHQGEPYRGLGGLTLRGKDIGKVSVAEQHVQFVVHPHHEVALGKDGTSNAGGVFRDTVKCLWLK